MKSLMTAVLLVVLAAWGSGCAIVPVGPYGAYDGPYYSSSYYYSSGYYYSRPLYPGPWHRGYTGYGSGGYHHGGGGYGRGGYHHGGGGYGRGGYNRSGGYHR